MKKKHKFRMIRYVYPNTVWFLTVLDVIQIFTQILILKKPFFNEKLLLDIFSIIKNFINFLFKKYLRYNIRAGWKLSEHLKIYIFDSDLVWRMQLMIIKG